MIAIDTNVVVRFLTNDDPDQSARARALVESGPILVPTTVVLETEWVLRSAYGIASTPRIAALRAFLGLPTVTTGFPQRIAQALDLADAGMDFADALHLEEADQAETFATFDRRFIAAAEAAGIGRLRQP